MHAESGFWLPQPDGTLEVVIAQSTGLVEVQVLSCYSHSFLFLSFNLFLNFPLPCYQNLLVSISTSHILSMRKLSSYLDRNSYFFFKVLIEGQHQHY